jgi:hypothetical protein
MKSSAEVDFEISNQDVEFLKNLDRINDYGAASMMPVFGGGKTNSQALIR